VTATSEEHPRDSDTNRPWLPAALSAALAFLLYAHTLAGSFVYDDNFQVKNDPRLKDVRLWPKYLTEGYFPNAADNLWRPLVSLSYALQYKLHGPHPFGFHLVNILLHAAASVTVAELARRLTDRKVALIAGLLFAAHPVHVEAVAYVVGRAESACTIGILGGLILATRPLTTRRAWAITACTAAAIFSKEQGLLTPFLLLALVWMRRTTGRFSPDEKKPARLLAAVLTLFMAAYITYRNHILPWYWETALLDYAIQPLIRSDLRDRILIPVALLGRYAALIAAPVKLLPDYGLAIITHRQELRDPYLWIGFAVLAAALSAAVIAMRRRDPVTLFLLFCAATTYFMVSNVMLIGTIFGERLIYVPSAFLLTLLARPIARLPARILWPTISLILALYSVRTFTYASQWRVQSTFYDYALRQNPRSIRLHVLLARDQLDRGQLDRARQIVDQGLAVSHEDYRLWVAAAQVAIAQGRFDDAHHAIQQAWKQDPSIGDVQYVENLLEKSRAATRPARR
jgi:hypothetical protein